MARRALRPATAKPLHFIAPVGGLNTVAPASEIPDGDCPVMWNMIGSEDGCRARLGSAEYVTGLAGSGGDSTVRTVMPYTGGARNGSKDRLFAATLGGIYDVTAGGTGPWVRKVIFGTQNGDAGYGTCWVTTTAADRFLIYTDGENGYFVYKESTDTWAKVTNGADPASQVNAPGDATTYVGGTLFKNRNWFVRDNSTIADFFPVNAIFGTPGQWDFGSKFKAGGILTNLYNWSYDGGSGMSNYLVAVSSAGDIVIYDGLNPTDASQFYLRGVWQGGGVPYGRRIATDFGGDGLVMTSMGIFPLSKLVIGNPLIDRSIYETQKISNLFSLLADQQRLLQGWSMRFHPNDAALVVTVPVANGQSTQQLVMSLATKGWSRYRGLDMVAGEAWHGKFFMGTHDGRILVSGGYVDEVKLADPTGQTFSTVDWSLVTRAEKSVNQRIPRHIRPTILSGQGPLVNAQVRLNFDQSEAPLPQGSPGRAAAAIFDVSKFDVDVWAGDFVTSQPVFGAAGKGSALAAAVRGSAYSRTVFAGVDIMYDDAGFL